MSLKHYYGINVFFKDMATYTKKKKAYTDTQITVDLILKTVIKYSYVRKCAK